MEYLHKPVIQLYRRSHPVTASSHGVLELIALCVDFFIPLVNSHINNVLVNITPRDAG